MVTSVANEVMVLLNQIDGPGIKPSQALNFAAKMDQIHNLSSRGAMEPAQQFAKCSTAVVSKKVVQPLPWCLSAES